ncbi:GntR family transcriptional regulator [Dactylosporangium roseum]|uniref:GntR family transcriptional regulator n=1 Tax=Dactylosporangium roseum TaxID=47989 RepID=A0ABY5ZE49_9ACTN|nr:GntR family transcriptional regulator [Dactylosporangium roseum]UWZ39225.1 GntR family transcriptional regulator [Dactylosporangium roseum]
MIANLRRAITDLEFKPSERLIERELIELTGASRTSVREALRKLEAEGLIRTIPHKGTYVAVPTREEAEELYEIRAGIEGLAASKFALHASEADIERLAGICEQLEARADSLPISELRVLKDSFYHTLCMHTTTAFEILRMLHARIALLRSFSLTAPGRVKESASEISEILKAISRRDAKAAAEAARKHVSAAGAVALRVLAEHPEYGLKTGSA